MKKLVKFRLLSVILANVFIIISGFAVVGSGIAIEQQGVINEALKLVSQEIVRGVGDEDLDSNYFKSSYNSVAEVIENAQRVSQSVVAEGSVLLKNEPGTLPLAKGSGVSLFSVSSVDLAYCGSGSSAATTGREVELKDGLERNQNLRVNGDLWSFYKNQFNTYSKLQNPGANISSQENVYSVRDASWTDIPTSEKTNTDFLDAAIFVLTRLGGESDDMIWNSTSGEKTASALGERATNLSNGNYLELTPREKTVLEGLNSLKGTGGSNYKKIIVLINSANPVQCDFVNDPAYGIDAVLWTGMLGEMGANAIGDLLVGAVNPSGKLSNTFFSKHAYNPIYANWGPKNMTGTTSGMGSNASRYQVYQEGIYNGYRYTETRYEDVVMGRDKTGVFDYNTVVSYPFGHGLSYTTFAYSGFGVTYDTEDDIYTVSINVKNTGGTAGKEAVQIYIQKPYTDYDITNKVEKAAVDLVGYAKTDLLPAGGDQDLTIEIKGSDFASYDSNGARTYILDAGKYYLTAAKDAHSAINNIINVKQGGTNSFVHTVNVASFSATKYAKSAATTKDITNQFDNTDLNKYEHRGSNSVTYVSRNDWEGTLRFGATVGAGGALTYQNNHVQITATQAMNDDSKVKTIAQSDNNYPVYREETPDYEPEEKLIDRLFRVMDINGNEVIDEYGNLKMQVAAYDDPMWNDLLDKLSWEDTLRLLTNGYRQTMGIQSIVKPVTEDPNGANGLVGSSSQPKDYTIGADGKEAGSEIGLANIKKDPDRTKKPVLYPSNGLVASTFDQKLAFDVGQIWGEDLLWAGCSGLYGTGINIHRGAHAGRHFEYYGEDGFLAGMQAGQVTFGMKTKGAYSYIKHVFLNDAEAYREGISTWANEQTIREIYLKPFEIVTAAVDGWVCVMTGFNRLGVVWTGHHGFMNTVMRNEFGMMGFAVSDYGQNYMSLPASIMAGNDLPDLDRSSWNQSQGGLTNDYGPGNNYGALAREMRESCKRILFTVVQSNAMNGFTTHTRIVIRDDSKWQKPLQNAVIAINVVTGIVVAGCAAILVLIQLDKKGIFKKENTGKKSE